MRVIRNPSNMYLRPLEITLEIMDPKSSGLHRYTCSSCKTVVKWLMRRRQ
jgi:hypothetical protein